MKVNLLQQKPLLLKFQTSIQFVESDTRIYNASNMIPRMLMKSVETIIYYVSVWSFESVNNTSLHLQHFSFALPNRVKLQFEILIMIQNALNMIPRMLMKCMATLIPYVSIWTFELVYNTTNHIEHFSLICFKGLKLLFNSLIMTRNAKRLPSLNFKKIQMNQTP